MRIAPALETWLPEVNGVSFAAGAPIPMDAALRGEQRGHCASAAGRSHHAALA